MFSANESELIEKCVDQSKSWKNLMQQYLDEDEKLPGLEKLKSHVQDIVQIDLKYKKYQAAFKKVDEYLDKNEDPSNVDVDKVFSELLNNAESSSNSGVTRTQIWQDVFQNEDDIMIVEKKNKKQLCDSQFDELDDSLLCSNVFTPPVDPISKTIIRNPFRNKKCKHVYEHKTIIDYINQLGHKAKCPYIGCNNKHLSKRDLVEDNQLQTNITQYLDTHDENQSSSDES